MNYILASSFCLISLFGLSQNQNSPEPFFFAIIVNDIEKSIDWYSQNLGFEVLNKTEVKERGLKQANLKSDNGLIELIELGSAQDPPNGLSRGFFKIGFRTESLDDWIKQLKLSNVEFHGNMVKDENLNLRTVIIKDPDGNRIQLFGE